MKNLIKIIALSCIALSAAKAMVEEQTFSSSREIYQANNALQL